MNRIRELRKEHGLSQLELSRQLDVNQTAVSQWERGVTTPSTLAINQLCKLWNVSIDYLLGESDFRIEQQPSGVLIPVMGDVRAGYPMEAIENIIDYEEIPEEMARRGEFFALRIKGDSMEPKFSEGDVIIVRKQNTIENGEIGVVLVNGDSATVKIVKLHEHGMTLLPTNPAYHPMYYDAQEVCDLPVVILGKVVELRAKF